MVHKLAVGDIVNGISDTDTALSFTPAAGVEVCITSVVRDGVTAARFGLKDASQQSGDPIDGTLSGNQNIKIFVTNTIFFFISATTGTLETGFSGITVG